MLPLPSCFSDLRVCRLTAAVLLNFCLLSLVPVDSRADELSDITAKAERGDAAAQYDLGLMFQKGEKVPKDEAAALAWFSKAAAQGHTKAEVNLGSIYAHGFGVPQDWAKSIEWYRKAAAKGDTTAEHNLGLDYDHGHGVERDAGQAARWYRLAADQGHARAQYNLGELYEDGRGVPQNDVEAFILYNLAAAHDNQEHIFGKAKAEEVLMKRARVEQRLNAEQIAAARQRVAEAQALVAVHPRKFGYPGDLGPSRGWFVWHSWNPETWEAEVSRDPPGEKWKVRVLPWATTYRYGVYGVRPDDLLPGEKVNIFFSPSATERRGLLVHVQDEVSQMKGHGHYWQVLAVDANARTFVGRIMAGDKPLGSPDVTFKLDPNCRCWRDGAVAETRLPAVDDKRYLTWAYRDGQPTVLLLADDASLDAVKKEQEERTSQTVAREGLSGQLEVIEGNTVYVLVHSTYWFQARLLKPGNTVRLTATGAGLRPQGEQLAARVVQSKTRGTYGSGFTDLVVELSSADDLPRIREWLDGRVIRVIP